MGKTNPLGHALLLAMHLTQYMPSGDSIASCSGDKTVRIWQRHGTTDTWICAAILEETHHRSIRCSSWSPDGRYLATASFDATTAIWEIQVGDFSVSARHAASMHRHEKSRFLCREAHGNRLHCLRGMKVKLREWLGALQVLIQCLLQQPYSAQMHLCVGMVTQQKLSA